MKKIGIIIFIIALIVGIGLANIFSVGKNTVGFFKFSRGISGSGNIVSENREVKDFKSVIVGGVFQVEVTAQKDFNLEIQADDNLLQFIKTEVSGDSLRIETTEKFHSKNPIIVKISAPRIQELEVSGASEVNVLDLDNEFLNVNASGASKLSLNGTTGKLIVEASGASRIEAENLKSENVSAEASGASHIDLFVSRDLRTDASGASKIFYSGTPESINNSISGAGIVKIK